MPLSARQLEYLALAWQCFETEPKIDYEKFATVASLKSAHSARELMRVTKNKLREEYGALSGEVRAAKTGGNGTPAGTPRKTGVVRDGEGTPKGKGKGRKGSGTPTPTAKRKGRDADGQENGEGDEEEVLGKKVKVEVVEEEEYERLWEGGR